MFNLELSNDEVSQILVAVYGQAIDKQNSNRMRDFFRKLAEKIHTQADNQGGLE